MQARVEEIATEHGRYSIRPYVAADLPAVLAAWQAAFGKPLAADLWRWKYHGAPLGNQILLCEHESGEVAALYGGVPFAADWRGRRLRITQLMDVFSHPGHRKQLGGRGGLFVRTATAFFTATAQPGGSALLYGLPGERHSRLGEHLLEYRRLPGGVACLEAETAKLARLRSRPFAGRLHRQTGPQLDGLDQLADACPADRLQARRDADFFRWRFLNHPVHRYWLLRYAPFTLRSSSAWRGCAVVLQQSSQAVLVDLVLPEDDPDARDLLRRTGAMLSEHGMTRLRTWLPARGTDVARLQALGFVRLAEPLGIIPTGRLFDPCMTWAVASSALHYTMADSDLF